MCSTGQLQQQRLMARIKNVIGTGIVTGATTGQLQIKTATGRTNDKIKRVHNYGFMSRPLVGAKTYNVFIGGVTARGVTVHVEDERHQIDLQPGEVAMLDDKGNLVHFTENGITVKTLTKLKVEAPESQFSGNVSVGGKLTVEGKVEGKEGGLFAGVSSENHDHGYTDDGVPKTSRKPNQ
ncbi:phage baseplate assembly protein [Vibrio splendidus]